METFLSTSDSAIIVLHEIYGINPHINQVCAYYKKAGFDVICPNLLRLDKAFEYSEEREAYQYFMQNIGFSSAVKQVKSLVEQISGKYKSIYILGFSIGATIAWLYSDIEASCIGIVGYYGSRIRDYLQVAPKCKTLLIFPSKEKSFEVNDLILALDNKTNISVHRLAGLHGFSDPFCQNYKEEASRAAEKLVEVFLRGSISVKD